MTVRVAGASGDVGDPDYSDRALLATPPRAANTPSGGPLRGAGNSANLNPAFVTQLQAMFAENPQLSLTSGWRSPEEQAYLRWQLLAGKRSKPVAPAGTSKHESGYAADIGPASQYQWLAKNAPRYGLTLPMPGVEPWHWELLCGSGGGWQPPASSPGTVSPPPAAMALQTGAIRPEELRGRAAGIIVGAVFGLTWAASALSRLSSGVVVPVLIASVAIFAVLMTGARRLRRAATALPASAPPGADLGKVRRRFTRVVAGECAAIVAAANILAKSDHSQWIPAVICAAVGLHFVPLARLFRVRLYYATAVALCLVAATTMILGASGTPAPLWQLLPGFGAALALWTTSATLLVTTEAALPPRRPTLELPGQPAAQVLQAQGPPTRRRDYAMEHGHKTRVGRILLWIFTVVGGVGVAAGIALATSANSPANRSGNPLADIGVAMGVGIAVLGGLVFVAGVIGLLLIRKR